MGTITDPVSRLMAMDCEMLTAADLAPVLHMNPGVIVKYAKDGTWDQDKLGKFVISGDRVKFFRKDFLVKCGFMDPDPEEPTNEELTVRLLSEINEGVIMLCQMMTLLMNPAQRDALNELLKEKSAGVAAPTE